MSSKRIFTIEPGDAFLPRLAREVLAGTLIPGFGAASGPLALASATILLPTRRAVRALRAAFAAASPSGAAILPDIRPLGEFADEAFDPGAAGEGGAFMEAVLANPAASRPPVSPHERLFALAPLVSGWRAQLPAYLAARFTSGEEVVLPASPADAIAMARELAGLIDEADLENAEWGRLARLADDGDLAGWWEVTLSFLNIVTTAWPRWLEDAGRSGPAAHGAALIDAYTAALRNGPRDRVIIAAGSTGSIAATARLLGQIAGMPNGAVVLPGFDTGLDPAIIAALQAPEGDPSRFGHPQYGMARLLARMKAAPADVRGLGAPPAPLTARRRLVSAALLPAEATTAWADGAPSPGALDGVALVEAANEREEGLAIAVALRRLLAEPGRTAALVTPDRRLARRVRAELLRFGIAADDSAGIALTATAPGSLLMRLAEALLGTGGAPAIPALTNHPLFCLGRPRGVMRALSERFELFVLRGRKGRPDPSRLAGEVEEALAALARDGRRRHAAALPEAAEIEAFRNFAAAFDAATAPLFAAPHERPLTQWLTALVTLAETCADAGEGPAALYAREEGARFAETMRSLIAASGGFTVARGDMPSVLSALLAGETVKPRPEGGADAAAHPRLSIWGTLEARLQSVDTLVLGGLNEGIWPAGPETGPFLSRVMRAEIHLEPPERRIGQAAHDFEQAMGARHVILTRALRAESAPAEPARFVQRLLAVAGEEGAAAMRAAGAASLELARRIDAAPREPFAPRPAPRAPAALRPASFTVTEIDTLRRDPYAVFARRILRLQPLPELIQDPGVAERGTLFHAILAGAVSDGIDHAAPDAAEKLTALARRFFDEERLEPDIDALWWPRFAALIPEIVEFEAVRKAAARARHAELRSRDIMVDATGVTLGARADRVDVLQAGGLSIMDYKTGTTPSLADARKLVSGQLALEAALAARGAFTQAGAAAVDELWYVRLGSRALTPERVAPAVLKGGETLTADGLAELAWERLNRLLHHFADPASAYVSRANPLPNRNIVPPYDHLARVLEWSAGGEEDEGGDE